ncbi:LOW QUALITY PROTEIN: uncharacterized protein LOC119555292 [Drosophila subpulchrella]|uniref:LOW QUALITY PROTEIN: uncharacterized protein LOC119555292 n=1 Tax=Drosophila subpulchrella TaxID=1486046 RepID=UPI0018A16801|nr:LOW QUALITY PROTEIN: uncharacterized protein LOC119555292 [Drosophila subpulchrella]
MEKHATARGFCLCHLICVWYQTGRIGLYLGFYNVGYSEELKKFICDEQLYVHIMAAVNLLASWLYLSFSHRWIYDQFVFLLYVPLYVYFLILRRHLAKLLNECAGVHKSKQRILGIRLCVKIHRECIYSLLLIVMIMSLLVWQLKIYSVYQSVFIFGVAFIYHFELLFFGNYLIWLSCIYRSLNEVLCQDMRSDRLYILRGVLRQQRILWRVLSRYFALHFISFMIQPGVKILIILQSSGQQLNGQMIFLTLQLHLLALFLIIALNLQKQHRKFQKSFLKLKDDPHKFVLKSWKILQRRTLPKAFGVTFIRKRKSVLYNQDVVTMMFTNNYPVLMLTKTPFCLTTFGFGDVKFGISLSMLRSCLKTHIRELLLMFVIRLLFHKNLTLQNYEYESQEDFNGNVTQTISQVYRFYFYDEFE